MREPSDAAVEITRVKTVLALGGVPWHALDDAVQQVHLKLQEHRADTRRASLRNPTAWSVVVASRIAVDWHRAEARDRALADRVALALSSDPSVTQPDIDVALDVAKLLESLTQIQRQVLVLRYFEDLTVADIAQALDVPEGTVKSRLHAAETSARNHFAASQGEESDR